MEKQVRKSWLSPWAKELLEKYEATHEDVTRVKKAARRLNRFFEE